MPWVQEIHLHAPLAWAIDVLIGDLLKAYNLGEICHAMTVEMDQVPLLPVWMSFFY